MHRELARAVKVAPALFRNTAAPAPAPFWRGQVVQLRRISTPPPLPPPPPGERVRERQSSLRRAALHAVTLAAPPRAALFLKPASGAQTQLMGDSIRCFMVVQLASGDVCLDYKSEPPPRRRSRFRWVHADPRAPAPSREDGPAELRAGGDREGPGDG